MATLVGVRIALCNFPPFVHAQPDGGNFYGPWVNAVLDALTESVAVTWTNLVDGACSHRELTELLCNDAADIAIHPMLLGSLDRQCVEWSYPMDSTGLVLVDDPHVRPRALLFAPFTTTTWLVYAATVACLILAMVLLDETGNRRRHVLRGTMAISGQMDVPGDAGSSIYILYTTFGIFTMLVLSVYTADLTSYLTQQATQPTTRLKGLIDDKKAFYVMGGVSEVQLDLDRGALTVALGGGYSIVTDPDTRLRPILVPAMVGRKMAAQACDRLRVSADEMQTLPVGIAMRSGFAMNQQIQRSLRHRVTSGKLHAEMMGWIRTKYECMPADAIAARPTLTVMWPIFTVAYVGIVVAVVVRFAPAIVKERVYPQVLVYRSRYYGST
jgi:hypothetical protein